MSAYDSRRQNILPKLHNGAAIVKLRVTLSKNLRREQAWAVQTRSLVRD
jgi:hypothetical protein